MNQAKKNILPNNFLYIFIVPILIIVLAIQVQAEPVFRLIYVVQEGDNLTTIAREFETKISLLREANGLSEKDFLLPGDELYIPLGEKVIEQEVELPNTQLFTDPDPTFQIMTWQEYPVRILPEPIRVNIPQKDRIVYHVKRGDNLYELARKFNTSVSIIKALNNMENGTIRIGQTLILPINGLTPKQVLARTISAQELNLLARVVHGEARGEPYMGQVAVAAVVINRVLHSYYPNTIEGVIYQSSQFESVSNGQFNLHPSSSAVKAAREAVAGMDPTLGAIYFINPQVASNTWWFEGREKTVTIGNHVFAK